MNKYRTLNNGIKIPTLGFGTYTIEEANTLKDSITTALDVGYRHIDTASYYNNEKEIGEILKESSIDRHEIFLTSKLWNLDHGYENTLKAFNTSCKNLKTDYIDLYLIHWPHKLHLESWKALEKLYKEGFIRAIGVSNYSIKYLEDLMNNFDIVPAVNQIEFHPYLIQDDLMDFCKQKNIQLEAWSPLMRGGVFQIELLKNLSIKYNKSISQIVLRWNLQMGLVTIPKSSNKDRIIENSNIFDFEISLDDIEQICNLNKNYRISETPDAVYENPYIFEA